MSNLGVLTSRLNKNTKSLREFDEALRLIKNRRLATEPYVSDEDLEKMLNVVSPLSEEIKNSLSVSTAINEKNVAEILRERHEREWPAYKEKLISLSLKLRSNNSPLDKHDLQLLEDIADALDAECENLFQRIRTR